MTSGVAKATTGFTGLCSGCGRRRPIRKDGTVGGHQTTWPAAEGPCDGGGQAPIRGTEVCRSCCGYRPDGGRAGVEPVRHRPGCLWGDRQPVTGVADQGEGPR